MALEKLDNLPESDAPKTTPTAQEKLRAVVRVSSAPTVRSRGRVDGELPLDKALAQQVKTTEALTHINAPKEYISAMERSLTETHKALQSLIDDRPGDGASFDHPPPKNKGAEVPKIVQNEQGKSGLSVEDKEGLMQRRRYIAAREDIKKAEKSLRQK
jgi:hypothetical protein